MTKWTSLPLKQNTANQCTCFDCLRTAGITRPVLDCMGLVRDRQDGRFTVHMTETLKDEKGNKTTQTVQHRRYIGT